MTLSKKQITKLLREEWDPIGLRQWGDLPADEYQSYSPRVKQLLKKEPRRAAAEIAAYLTWVRVYAMRLPSGTDKALHRDAVAALMLVQEHNRK